MAYDQKSINLLGDKNRNLTDQILDWALAIGRLLVIITEVVALAAFLYRFSIDRRLLDLHDEIKNNQPMVTYFKQGEDAYRHLEKKLLVSKKNQPESNQLVPLFNEMLHLAQVNNISYNTLTIQNNTIEISAQAASTITLQSFFNTLRKRPDIETLHVEKVENRPANAVIIMSATATLKGRH